MKHYTVAGAAAALTVGGLIAAAATAGAGCQYGGIAASKCDGPVQPDGTWQRCMVWDAPNSSTYSRVDRRCDVVGPDLHPWGLTFNDPPTHIDD